MLAEDIVQVFLDLQQQMVNKMKILKKTDTGKEVQADSQQQKAEALQARDDQGGTN
jgi:hypothetical protein